MHDVLARNILPLEMCIVGTPGKTGARVWDSRVEAH